MLIEAEFHCVWRQPDGSLLDITAKSVPVPRILFVPDARRFYLGRQVDNMRRPLTHDPAVARFCKVDALIHQELNAGELADMHGEVPVTRRFVELQNERTDLLRTMFHRYGLNPPEPLSCNRID